MAAFNVYLGEIGSTGLTDKEKSDVKTKLEGWFGKIVDSGDTALVSWTSSAPASIQDNELLVYYVSGSSGSILKVMPGNTGGSGNGNGLTVFGGSLTGSEIYVSSSKSGLAELTFHELLHNKLHLDDANLHKKDGLAAATVPIGGQPSTSNISDMNKALKNKNKQWTGGWLAFSDPINGYL
ncbi:MAG TPA: hypothetical protein VGC76_19040 [Pyrinomonadaceae bacterium]|jgi:hypothetical protein